MFFGARALVVGSAGGFVTALHPHAAAIPVYIVINKNPRRWRQGQRSGGRIGEPRGGQCTGVIAVRDGTVVKGGGSGGGEASSG